MGFREQSTIGGVQREMETVMADETWASFSLYRWPFNPAYAEVFDLVFKLPYTTDGQNTPRLEVFVDSDLAKEKDWRIYGAPGDESDDVAEIHFRRPGSESRSS